jgi:aminoglycoside phosphotransferase (APT) family kinase protein
VPGAGFYRSAVASITSVPASLRRSRARLRAPLDGLRGRLTALQVGPLMGRILEDIAASHDRASDGAGEGAGAMAGWTVQRARRTTGSGFVALAGPPGCPAVAVRTAADPRGLVGLVREHDELAAVAALELPPSFRRLLPRPVAAGRVGDTGYLAEQALPGEVLDPRRLSAGERTVLLDAIAGAIRPLHDASATVCRPSSEDLDAWVDRRVALVWSLIGVGSRDRGAEARLVGAATTLTDSLWGREVRTTRVHGDLWTGNVLVELCERGGIEVSGIVDWDSSAYPELPFQDLLHLELYTRKLVARSSLGEVVADALVAQSGSAVGGAGRSLTHREELLLYWLRQVEVNVARNPRVAASPRWRQRNVDPVLACL